MSCFIVPTFIAVFVGMLVVPAQTPYKGSITNDTCGFLVCLVFSPPRIQFLTYLDKYFISCANKETSLRGEKAAPVASSVDKALPK